MDDVQAQHIKMMEDKKARFAKYQEDYAEQLRLLGFIKSLEEDNEHIDASAVEKGTSKAARQAKKLKKINDKDIKRYLKILDTMPEVPEFR